MTLTEIVIFVIGLVLSAAAIAPAFGMKIWWMRICIYGRQQLFWLLLICLIAYLFISPFRRPVDGAVAALAMVALLFCLRSFIVYLPFMPREKLSVDTVEDGSRLSLLIANVLQTNRNFEGLLKIVRDADADVVFLSETNQDWAEGLERLEDTYPHSVLLPLDDFNGLLLYSKFPIRACEKRRLVQDHVPSLTLDLELSASTPLRLYALHPRPPRPEDAPDALDTEMKIVAREVAVCPMPVIVTGDLNEVGWSRALQRFLIMSNLCDPRRGNGIYNTYNAKVPLLRWPLDHAFHDCEIALIGMERLSAFGSDHFPMLFKFDVPASLSEV